MEWYDKLAMVVAGIGALNWGLLQFMKMNLVDYLPDYATYLYAAIAIAGIYTGYLAFKKK